MAVGSKAFPLTASCLSSVPNFQILARACEIVGIDLGCMYEVASILHMYKSRFNNAVCNVCTHAWMNVGMGG